MTTESDPERFATYHAAISVCLLASLLTGFFLVVEPYPWTSLLTILRLCTLAWEAALGAVLWRQRAAPRLQLCLVIFGLALAPLVVMSWVATDVREAHQVEWEPLLRHKFAMLLIAVLAPPRTWVGALAIAVFAVEACLEYWFGVPSLHDELEGHALYEPWATLATAALAEGLLVALGRHMAREIALVRKVESLSSASRLARMALAVRDLANTPLQILEIRLALLEKNSGDRRSILPMKRAIKRLAELSERLRRYELGSHQDSSLDSNALLGDHDDDTRAPPRSPSRGAPRST